MPAPAAVLQLLLEGPSFEAFQDLCVDALSLAVAPRVCHRSVAYLRSNVSTVRFEEITGELRTVVGDDVVGQPKSVHEALDELDCRARWEGAVTPRIQLSIFVTPTLAFSGDVIYYFLRGLVFVCCLHFVLVMHLVS